jgi:NADP-dependent 3-hydroxy acid dehydrogenase YdfG
VLSIYPGRTATPRQARIFEMEGRPYAPDRLLQPEDIATMIVAALKLPRTAEVTNLTIRPMLKA